MIKVSLLQKRKERKDSSDAAELVLAARVTTF
jgi:hypothetical protein